MWCLCAHNVVYLKFRAIFVHTQELAMREVRKLQANFIKDIGQVQKKIGALVCTHAQVTHFTHYIWDFHDCMQSV